MDLIFPRTRFLSAVTHIEQIRSGEGGGGGGWVTMRLTNCEMGDERRSAPSGNNFLLSCSYVEFRLTPFIKWTILAVQSTYVYTVFNCISWMDPVLLACCDDSNNCDDRFRWGHTGGLNGCRGAKRRTISHGVAAPCGEFKSINSTLLLASGKVMTIKLLTLIRCDAFSGTVAVFINRFQDDLILEINPQHHL